MGQLFDSGALHLVRRALGLAGGSGAAQRTELEDSAVTQVLDIGTLVSRGLTPMGGGIGLGILETNHGAGATTKQAALDPYNVGPALALGRWPAKVREGLDIWIFGASVTKVSGTLTNYESGILEMLGDAVGDGAWSVDETGAAAVVGGTLSLSLARWDVLIDIAGVGVGLTEQGAVHVPIGRRLRRGMTLSYSSAATNAIVSRCIIHLGLLATGLGQDAST